MGSIPKTLSCIIITVLIIQWFGVTAISAEVDSSSKPVQGHCTTDDLNHSVLVECDDSSCEGPNEAIWPENREQVIHMYSSRAGERFVVDKLPNLDYQETEQVRMFDINNTLYVKTNSNKLMGSIKGFGTTVDLERLLAQFDDSSFDKNYGLIMKDLFGSPPYGNGFTILRIPITRANLLAGKNNDISSLIVKLDTWALNNNVDRKIKIIVSLEDIENGHGLHERLMSLSRSFQDCKTCWAVAINNIELEMRKDGSIYQNLKSIIGTDNIYGLTNLSTIEQDPNLIAPLPSYHHQSFSSGILVKTEFSTVYNILDDLKKLYPNNMLTIGGYRQQVVEYGDWLNARNYAVTILNLLKHGSNGFIEELSNVDIMADRSRHDTSIYNLRPDHNVHFKGPMYYAIGHFSRHLAEGSELLETSVTTAPNMFAAQYGAFKIRNGVVVAIVLNDNEHLLPFRLAVDGRIKAFTNIKPKSFNTFVIDERIDR